MSLAGLIRSYYISSKISTQTLQGNRDYDDSGTHSTFNCCGHVSIAYHFLHSSRYLEMTFED